MKQTLILLIAGIAAGAAVLATAPAADQVGGWTAFTPRDILMALGALFGPIVAYHGADPLAKIGTKTTAAMLALLCMLGLSGCALSGATVTGGLDPSTGAVTGTVGVTIKSPAEIAQAIADEKAILKAEIESYKKATAEQKTVHDLFRKAHKDRLKILESGKWAPPVAESHTPTPPVVINEPPVTLPPVFLPEPGAGVKRAVLYGINKYPGAPLRGCVNDILNVKKLLIERYGFEEKNIVLLTDEAATKATILAALKQAVFDTKAADTFVTWGSGHGTEYPGPNNRVAQVFCPINFEWTEDTMIADFEFKEIFSHLPLGAACNWGSDSCHSGDLDRMQLRNGKVVTARHYPNMPPEVAAKIARAKARESYQQRELINGELNIGYVSGCGKSQTSADTENAAGQPCGAMTDTFLSVIRQPGAADTPLSEIVKRMDAQLTTDGYDQRPEVSGARRDKPFLK